MIRPRLSAIFTLVLFFGFLQIVPPPLQAKPVKVEVSPIDSFRPSQPEISHFGRLEFLGGIVLTSDDPDFGGISGARMVDECCRSLFITDQGHWITAELVRNNERLTGLRAVEIFPVLSRKGKPLTGKSWSDGESLEVSGNHVFAGFERRHRVERYKLGKDGRPGRRTGRIAKEFDGFGISSNKGLEGLIQLNEPASDHRLFLGFAERALDESGNHTAFIIRKDRIESFHIVRSDGFDITDAVLLENSDLLLLERRYSILAGPYMRIRRLPVTDIESGATVESETIFVSDWGDQIDNMEGVTATPLEDDAIRLTIVSDNNFSNDQRTLLLEFRFRP